MGTRLVGFAGAALLLGFAVSAGAQGSACQITGSAIIESGVIDEDANPGSGAFGFTGELTGLTGDCDGLQVCSIGVLASASCLGNAHEGSGAICESCSLSCNGGPCDSGTIGSAVIDCTGERRREDFFQGVCVGAACTGSSGGAPGIAYALLFDAGTVTDALSVCDDPTAPDDSIESAGFTGVLAHGGP